MPADGGRAGALIALAGDLPPAGLIAELAAAHAMLISADGAAIALMELGIRPEIVIGDLDSLGAERARIEAAGIRIIERPSQEMGDLEKALEYAIEAALANVTVIGTGGGMIDHTINNFSVLARYARRLRITLRDAASTAYLPFGHLRIATAPDDRVSLIPLPEATVTTEGLVWELENARLGIGLREGASNRARAGDVWLTVHTGTLLVVHYPTPRS